MRSFIRKYSYFVITLIPLACLIFFVVRYKLSFPIQDQWDLVPLLDKSYQGTLSFFDLWAQHNEHRPFFPRIIMLILARSSRWDISYELAMNILFAIGIFATLVYQVKMTAKSVSGLKIKWIIPIISLAVFSLSQWENWLCGWQMQIFLNVFAVSTGIRLLCSPVFKWKYFVTALLLGIVATYSFANGLSFWLIGLGILFLSRKTKRKNLVLWLLAGLFITCSYFHNYHKPLELPSYKVIFYQPLAYVQYVFCYLGAPLAAFNTNAAFLLGLSGLILPLYIIRLSIRLRYPDFSVLIPYLSISLYAVFSALATGVGRAGFDIRQALTSRYITISSLFWVCNIIFLFILSARDKNTLSYAGKINLKKYIFPYAIKIIIFLLIVNSAYGYIVAIRRYYLLPPGNPLISGEYDDILKHRYGVYIEDIKGEGYLDILKKYRLSIFREDR